MNVLVERGGMGVPVEGKGLKSLCYLNHLRIVKIISYLYMTINTFLTTVVINLRPSDCKE